MINFARVIISFIPNMYNCVCFDSFQEYICPRCDSGFIEEVTEDSR